LAQDFICGILDQYLDFIPLPIQRLFTDKISVGAFGKVGSGYLGLPGQSGPSSRCPEPQERKALELIAEGRSTKMCTVFVHVNARTAETYYAQRIEKLGIDETATTVRDASRRGGLSNPSCYFSLAHAL
jgi:hypothetical protein